VLARLRSLIRNLRRRAAFEDGMDDEMRFHLERRARDLVRRGLSPADAARRARLEFGPIEKQKDEARASAGLRVLDEIAADLRYAVRTSAANKGFALTAVVTLALGIGANTAIFSLMDALVLRWLPVDRPQDLLQLTLAPPDGGTPFDRFSYPLAGALGRQHDVFAVVGGFAGFSPLTVGTGPSMQRVSGAAVTGQFYDTLGLRPALGRLLGPADDAPGAPAVAVVSYGYWERQFASDPGVVGRAIVLNGVPADVVGVSPRGFTGADVGKTADVTVAVAALPRLTSDGVGMLGRGNEWLRVLARLRPGVSQAQAAARLAAAWPQIAAPAINAQWPAWRQRSIAGARIVLRPGGTGSTSLRQRYVKPLQVLMGIVALVLLIACANVASLLLARGNARRREIAVRLAIGAGRARIIRQLLVESAVLSITGTAAGICIATLAGPRIVSVISTPRAPVVLDLTPNWHVLAFAAAAATLTTVMFGLAPAMQSTATHPGGALKDGARGGTARSKLLPSLVAAQVALSLMLLIGAALFVRTLKNLETMDPGFRSQGVLLASLDPRRASVGPEVLDGIRRLPGVVSASLSTHTPLSGSLWSEPALPAGQRLPDRDTALFVGASPDFFRTLGIPILAGRGFTALDTRASSPVAIVNEVYAARYFPHENPLGRHLTAIVRDEPRDLEIVGVATGTSTNGLRKLPPFTIYVPYAQLAGDVTTNVEVRASGRLGDLAPALKEVLQPLVPDAPVDVTPLSAQVDASIAQERMMALLGACFGLLALTLAAVGIYGLLAYGVAQRTRELGIRAALGARPSSIIALVLRGAWIPLGIGTIAGLAGAWPLARLVESMLFVSSRRTRRRSAAPSSSWPARRISPPGCRRGAPPVSIR